MTQSILFDESHNETWTIEKYRAITNSLENPLYYSYAHIQMYIKGLLNTEVYRNTETPINSTTLSDHSVLVITHPADPSIHKGCGGSPIFSPEEIQSIREFVSSGAGLFVLYEYEVDRWKSNINELLAPYGLAFENDVVQAQYRLQSKIQSTTQFEASKFGGHATAQGLQSVSYYTGCSINAGNQNAKVVVAGPNGEPLCVCTEYGHGRVCIIGDTDLFALPYINQFDNFSFLMNLIQWLLGKEQIDFLQQDKIREKEAYKPSIFLSYAREDHDVVAKIYEILRFYGCNPWLDKQSILAGENFELAIMEGIKNCDFFMPCISKNSIDKRGFLQKEIRTALSIAEGMLDSDIYVIPLRLDNSIPHGALTKYQWVNIAEPNFAMRIMLAIAEGVSRRVR